MRWIYLLALGLVARVEAKISAGQLESRFLNYSSLLPTSWSSFESLIDSPSIPATFDVFQLRTADGVQCSWPKNRFLASARNLSNAIQVNVAVDDNTQQIVSLDIRFPPYGRRPNVSMIQEIPYHNVPAPILKDAQVIQIAPDGKPVQKEPEKSFLAKYWMYIIPVLLIFTIGGGAQPEEQRTQK